MLRTNRRDAIAASDNFHRAGLARGHNAHLIAGLDRALPPRARKSAKIEIGPIDPLHLHGKALVCAASSASSTFSRCASATALIPSRLSLRPVILSPPSRYGMAKGAIEIGGKGSEIIDNVVEAGFAEIHQIHLTDRQNNMFNAQ